MRTIDDWLKSEERGTAFSHCLCCRLPLVETMAAWLVTKEFVADECVLEYAICQPCRDAMTRRLSEESKESVREFLEREIDWDARLQEFMAAYEVTSRFDHCIACQSPRDELPGFGISALFDSGGELTTGPLPLLICHPCVRQMTSYLSQSSRKVWDDFLAKYFPTADGRHRFPGWL